MIKTYEVNCDLCKSDDAEVLVRGGDRLYGGEDIFTYFKCKNCGLVYMNPRVCPEDMAKLYPEDYAPHQRKNTGGDKCKNSLGARLKRTSVLAGLQNMRKTSNRQTDGHRDHRGRTRRHKTQVKKTR